MGRCLLFRRQNRWLRKYSACTQRLAAALQAPSCPPPQPQPCCAYLPPKPCLSQKTALSTGREDLFSHPDYFAPLLPFFFCNGKLCFCLSLWVFLHAHDFFAFPFHQPFRWSARHLRAYTLPGLLYFFFPAAPSQQTLRGPFTGTLLYWISA